MRWVHTIGSRLFSVVLVGVAVVGLLAAILHPGIRATEVDLHDGGVWVTNAKKKLVAHLNYAAQDFDSALRMTTGKMDVFQDGKDVLVSDAEAQTLARVDVAHSALGGEISAEDLHITARAQHVVFADPDEGSVWVQRADSLRAVSRTSDTPAIAELPNAKVALSDSGTLFAVSAQTGTLTTLLADAPPEAARTEKLPEVEPTAELEITTVGEHPIVLNRTTSTLYLPDNRLVKLPEAAHTRLQQPSAHYDDVLVATDSGTVLVPLDTGEPRIIEAPVGGGVPVAPVRVGKCSYSAWMGSGAFVRDCSDDALDQQLTVDTLARSQSSVFRVNRNLVVLNDVDTGHLWLPDKNMLLIENWDQVESTLTNDQNNDDDSSASQNNEISQAEQREENSPPIANDDSFGVRAGRSNVLPVLNNDSDPDGDYIVITRVDPSPLGEITISRDGGALSLRLPEGATGSAVVSYDINDGRGGTATASVSITVHGKEINSAPVQTTKPVISLNPGRTATINTLTYWHDPDSDPFYLSDIIVPEGLSARFRETGTVDVSESGHGPGENAITLRVSDGRDVAEGELGVIIRDETNLPPTANPDHVVVLVGQTVSIAPMANDVDPNGDPLRLVQVDSGNASVTAQLDGALGTVSITGHAVGTHYLGYVITDNPTSVKGYIRVDVIEVPENATPAAEDDLGVLPEVGQVMIDLLANDYDPSGGVLTVQGIHLPNGSPLQVSLIDRHVVRVTAPQGLRSVAHFTYTATNGQAQADAHVTIIPGPAADVTAAPLLTDDSIVVRAGDVGSVHVLANDRSPVGLSMTVNNTLQSALEPNVGTAFISDNVVRIRGGDTPGSGTVVYTVTDSAGNVSSATVHVTVVEQDEENNTAPLPRVLTARTTAGQDVRIPVPLDGIDREGDSVSLVSMGSSPKLGTAIQEGDSFIYSAGESVVGTDSFSYIVEDRLGKQAIGTIRVGISPASTTNQAPVAIPDEVRVRPGTKVSVPVLQNDLDPDGDPLTLVPHGITAQDRSVEFGARGNTILVHTPTREGTYLLTYGLADRYGATAEGLVTLIVSEQAPLLPPIARDDVLTEEQATQARKAGRITIDVRENDADPDGDIREARVTSGDSNATVTPSGELDITLTAQPQIIVYTVTDGDDQAASAFVRVPSLETTRPVLDLSASLIRVKAGERIDIPLNDYITSRDGRSVQLLSTTSVSAGIGADGSSLVKDRQTLTFRSLPEFSGRTSITVEVTDAQNAQDQNGQTASVTLPIEVEAAGNRPPTLRLTPVVLQKGGESAKVNLAVGASDPDPQDAGKLTFALSSTPPAGITAQLAGSTLTLSATAEATVGNSAAVSVTVTDPQGATANANIDITVQGKPVFPLIQTTDAHVSLQGTQPATIDITEHATQPQADKLVQLVGQPTVTTGGVVSASGQTLTVRATEGFSGTFIVTYTVSDDEDAADAEGSRRVTGRIIASVQDRPGAPRQIRAEPLSPTSVRVSWQPGSTGGSPITGFTVTDHTQGDSIDCGVVTQCVINSRTTGVNHVFSVVARNAVGDSDPSSQAQVMLDVAPNAPGAPTVSVGDRSVTVTWQAPLNNGTPIGEYEVQLSPGVTKTVGGHGRAHHSVTFEGLINGTQYVARVRATNAVGASPWSGFSAPATPYGAPGPVNSLVVRPLAEAEAADGTTTVIVSWVPGTPNGRPVEYYTVTGASQTYRLPAASGTSLAIPGIPLSNDRLSFSVTATNDSSRPEAFTSTPVTVTQWIVGTPLSPRVSSVRATGRDHEVELMWSPAPDGRGWRQADLSYEWSADGVSWHVLRGNTLSGPGLVNGRESVIKIRSVGNKTGYVSYSQEAVSGAVTPFGPPTAAQITCTPRPLGVECAWSGGSGNGRPITHRLTYPAPTVVQPQGSQFFDAQAGQTLTVCIDVTQEGGTSVQTCHSATAEDKPKAKVHMKHDGRRVTLFFTGYPQTTTGIECWNASGPAEMRRANKETGDPGTYVGSYGRAIQVPDYGLIVFSCEPEPGQPVVDPNESFHIYFTATNEWIGPTP